MTKILTLSIARTADGNGLPLPTYSSKYHVGLNLQAAVPSALRLEPGDRAYVPTGFAIGVPAGYCGYVVSQPALAKEKGLIVLDAPQVIHPADRGPLFLLLQNLSTHLVVLHRGDVVAQLILQPVVQATWNDLSSSKYIENAATSEVVIDASGAASEKEDNSKMVSARRVYKDPRHRFSEGGETNEG